MASELTDPKYNLAKSRIQDKCNEAEQKLLVLFSEAYAKDDIPAMRVCLACFGALRALFVCVAYT